MADNKNVLALEPTSSGGVFVAPLGTAAPTSATSTLDPAFVSLGHVGEDGVTETTDRNIEKKRNWGGETVKTLQTDYSKTFSWVFIESLNADVLKAIHNEANVSVIDANSSHGEQIQVKHNSKRPERLAWVIDSIDSELGAKYRTFIPEGQVLTTGDVMRVHSDLIQYEIELEAFKNADLGYHSIDWTDNGSLVIPVPPNWQATHVYAAGEYAKLTGGKELIAVAGGTSGASAPTAPGLGNFVSDGSVVWKQISA